MLWAFVEVVLLLAQGLYKALFRAPDFKSLEPAVETSFGVAERWLEQWTQGQVRISRVQEAGALAAEEAERLREALFERGVRRALRTGSAACRGSLSSG